MKGLLLKDLYQIKSYCRSYVFVVLVFFAVAFASEENIFFVIYPCFLCGMIPVTLLSYDEASRWNTYSLALPYTRSQLVSAKYLIGLILQTGMVTLTGIAQFFRMRMHGNFDPGEFVIFVVITLAASLLAPAVCLPMIFRYGVEKGRIVFYFMIGLMCAIGFAASRIMSVDTAAKIDFNAGFLLFAAVGIGIYALSWYLAVQFYKKREMN